MLVGQASSRRCSEVGAQPARRRFEPERDGKPKFTGFREFLSSLCPLAANVTPIEVSPPAGIYRVPAGSRVAPAGASRIVDLPAQAGELAPHCLNHRFVHARMNVRRRPSTLGCGNRALESAAAANVVSLAGAPILSPSRPPVEGDSLSGSMCGLSNLGRGSSSARGRFLQPDLTAE
jgi:hypothetical protein